MLTTSLSQTVDFLFKLTDIQIKKYKALTVIGVGPDAGMNAQLVVDEANELLDFLAILLPMLEKGVCDESKFCEIFSQIYFYVDQEWLRGRAAWLVDENNIHNPEYHRLIVQRQQLDTIARDAQIENSLSLEPKTPTQQQCEHDSNAIAFLVLKAALDQKQTVVDPEFKLDETVLSTLPRHALAILKKHAQEGGRYWKQEFLNPMEELHQVCKQRLETSVLQKSDRKLNYEQALAHARTHGVIFDAYLARYKIACPDSPLFRADFVWYSIGSSAPKPIKPSGALTRAGTQQGLVARNTGLFLFGSFVMVSISMLIYYICQDQGKILGGNSSFRPN